jgi:hypothetical protein
MGCNSSVGFALNGQLSAIFGYAKNLFVGTSNVTIPRIGTESSSGKFPFTPGGSFQLRVYLADTLGVDLNFTLKNLTTGLSSSGIITAGNYLADTSGNVSFSSGDQMAVIVSLASGAQVIPFIQWDSK